MWLLKHLFVMGCLFLAVVNSTQANISVKPKACGLSEIRDQGEIKFANDSYSQSAVLRINIDPSYRNFNLKLSDISLEQLERIENSELIKIKVKTPSEHLATISSWRRGMTFEVSELDSSKQLEFDLIVQLPRTKVPAGQYSINMNWELSCY